MLLVEWTMQAEFQQIDVSGDRVERSSELVAHDGEKVGLRAVRLVEALGDLLRLSHASFELGLRVLDALGHRVERPGEAPDFVQSPALHAPTVVPRAEGLRRRVQFREWARESPADDRGDQRSEQQQE